MQPDLLEYILRNYQKSHSQLQQDLWALYKYKEKYKSDLNGYFVEFGATDGKTLSNSFILEKTIIGQEFWSNLQKHLKNHSELIGARS